MNLILFLRIDNYKKTKEREKLKRKPSFLALTAHTEL